MPRRLHIIAFDIPYPANYGGVIVVFYHLKKLAAKGVKITLHCFQYGDRQPQAALAEYCEAVHYYPRSRQWYHQFSTVPFIVKTRRPASLLRRLCADDAPILMEGLHCTGFLTHPALANRLKLVRMHNIEWQYYHNLAQLEKRWWYAAYLHLESQKLKRYETQVLPHANQILTLTAWDTVYFKEQSDLVTELGPFHAHERLQVLTGRGDYVLFHGKLSVEDNEKAAFYLIDKVLSKTKHKFVVAGMHPSARLTKRIAQYPQMTLIANPSEDQMFNLIQEAQINVLLSFQVAGIKLKLLNALYTGRHCVVNEPMVTGTELAQLCTIANEATALRNAINSLWSVDFSAEKRTARAAVLLKKYSNEVAAHKTIQILDRMKI